MVSNDLMYVDLPIVDRDVCLKLLENITDLPPGMFCAGYMEGMKDACQVRIPRRQNTEIQVTRRYTINKEREFLNDSLSID